MTESLVNRMLVQLDDIPVSGPITRWHRLIPEGVFQHPKHGTLDFREPFFAKLKENFDNRVRGVDVMIDLHHNDTSDAGGWILQTDYRPGDGLWGEVEWTSLGVEKVRGKLLRYFSAEFGPHKDEVTGVVHKPVLAAVTLTNRPYLKRQDAIVLADDEPEYDVIDLTELTEDVELAAVPAAVSKAATSGRKVSAITAMKKSGEKKSAPDPDDDEEDEEDVGGGCDCGKPAGECKCTEGEDAAAEATAEAAGPRTEPAPPIIHASRTGSAGKKSTRKPAGNQGAPQPGQMRGPKPHITRGRSPDPTSEAAHMSEPTNPVINNVTETVSLKEFTDQKELLERISAKLNEKDAERVKLAEESVRLSDELKAMRLRERTRDVGDDCRRLSEARSVTVGETDVTTNYGIPAVVADMYRAMALSDDGFTREGVYGLLVKLKETGAVALTERGTASADMTHDPEVLLSGAATDDKIFKLAETAAREAGKTFAALSASEKESYFMDAERKVRK